VVPTILPEGVHREEMNKKVDVVGSGEMALHKRLMKCK